MPQLDNYLVTLGVKGQNVVLSQMDKIQKKGRNLSKSKTVVDLAAKQATQKAKTSAVIESAKTQAAINKKVGVPDKKDQKKDQKKDDAQNSETMGKAVKKFGNHTDKFAHAAATLSPSSFIQTIASTLPFLGAAAMAAGGAMESAKSSTAGAYELSKRNTATNYYGGDKIRGRASENQGSLSNSEHAMFVSAVSGSMGKIQKPLADAINGLIGKKDTRALARVAAGDWESTGTDKGWMASQIMSGMEGLPPSIKQKIQASMLKNFSGEIQDVTGDQTARQGRAAYYENAQEKQTTRLADTAASASFVDASGKMVNSMMAMNDALNDMQNAMVKGAGKMVTAISMVTDATMNSKTPRQFQHPTIAGFNEAMRLFK